MQKLDYNKEIKILRIKMGVVAVLSIIIMYAVYAATR